MGAAESLAGFTPAGGYFPEGDLPSVRRTMGIEAVHDMMRIKLFSWLLLLGISNQSVAQESKALADPAAIHQLFKSCKKDKALYTCSLMGKNITAILNKSKNSFTAPTLDEGLRYDLYWWPDACVPPAKRGIPNRCVFNLLLQPTTR